jgi:hypothetical protein
MTCNRLWAVSTYLTVLVNRSDLDPTDGEVLAYKKSVWLSDELFNALPSVTINLRRQHLLEGGHNLRRLLDTVVVCDLSPRTIGATDPRDCVYALLGIANDEAAKDIVADYTLSCEQAYIMTARALLRHGHDDTLSLCRKRDPSRNLPSWVPDWCAGPRKPWSVWHVDERMYDASIISNETPEFSMVPRNEQALDSYLTLRGFFVDTIRELGYAFHLGPDDDIEWGNLQPYFNNISRFLDQSKIYTSADKKNAE